MRNKIIYILKQNKFSIIILFVLFSIVEIIGVFNLILSANLIDSLVFKNFSYSYNIVWIIIIITIISILINYIFNIYKTKMTNDLSFYIERESYNSLYNSSYKLIKKEDKLLISQKLLKDSINISSFILNNLFNVVINFITIIILFVILWKKHIIFATISFVTLPIYFLLLYYIRNSIHTAMYEARENRDIYSGTFTEKIKNIYTIKSFAILNGVFDKIKGLYAKKLKSLLKEYNIFYFFYSIDGIFTLIVQTMFFFLGIKYICEGILTIGDFTVVLTFYQLIVKNFNYYLMLGKDYEDFSISVKRMDDIQNIIKDVGGDISLYDIESIKFNNCKYNIDGDKCIEYGNFILSRGDIIKIEGNNGSGKSTLINIIIGLYNSSDTVFINNIDTYNLDMGKIRNNLVSYLNQDFEFIEGTALENINFYLQTLYDKDSIVKKLDDLKLYFDKSDIINILEKNINSLSEGQKQIVGLIIVFFKNTSFIILDEPFKGLDVKNRRIVLEYLKFIQKKKLILLIEHTNLVGLDFKIYTL